MGKKGEELALRFLKSSGYTILDRNFKYGRGEIDIVAKDADTIAFVEVKSRSSDEFGAPEETVGVRKQRQLSKLARAYLQQKRLFNRADCRFDVVAISFHTNTIRLIKNAFPSTYLVPAISSRPHP